MRAHSWIFSAREARRKNLQIQVFQRKKNTVRAIGRKGAFIFGLIYFIIIKGWKDHHITESL